MSVARIVPPALVIGCWHNVEGTWNSPSSKGEGSSGLWRQLKLIQRLGTVVPLEWALTRLDSGRALPRRAISITFDDGYRDNLEIAVPMLERLGMTATFFLSPGLLGREIDPWWERLAWGFRSARASELEWDAERLRLGDEVGRRAAFRRVMLALKGAPARARQERVGEIIDALDPAGSDGIDGLFMDWDDARAAMRRGVAIESHSERHTILAEEAPDRQLADLVAARARLQTELGVEARLLAYPNGGPEDVSGHTVDAAVRAGHTHGLMTVGGVNTPRTDPFALRRNLVTAAKGTQVVGPLRRRVAARFMRARKGPRSY